MGDTAGIEADGWGSLCGLARYAARRTLRCERRTPSPDVNASRVYPSWSRDRSPPKPPVADVRVIESYCDDRRGAVRRRNQRASIAPATLSAAASRRAVPHVVEDEQPRGGDRGGERLAVADREERIRAAVHDE